MSQDKRTKYSVVIPVYNSARIVGQTVDRTVAFFEKQGWDYELILVNDGSPDASWEVLREKAQENPHVTAIDLLRNYGQHTAVFCGLQASVGDYVITMDDDLQNPPGEIAHLVGMAEEGYDLVFGRFHQKRHLFHRRVGSEMVRLMNRCVFHQPKDLVLTNFRIMRRDVVDRMCAYHTSYPYIPGLALMFARRPANVWVEHQARPVGKSNYSLVKIAELVMRILFNYSSFPLRVVSSAGMVISVGSFLLGLFYLGRGIFAGSGVQGWTSLVVLLSFLNGITILILGMLGEYTIRLLNQVSRGCIYHVQEKVHRDM